MKKGFILLVVLFGFTLLTLQSSISTKVTAQGGTTFVVNSTADTSDLFPGDGQCNTTMGGGMECTLRAAIQEANALSGAQTIQFNIPGTAPHTITVNSPLPGINDPVSIDGTSEPGYSGAPVIEVSGNGLDASGFFISAGDSTIRALVINGFLGSGILVNSSNNTIQGNYIGTNLAGTAADPNSGAGIRIVNGSNNLIGGSGAGQRNVISGNGGAGVEVIGIDISPSQNTIRGNFIGTDVSGSNALGNALDGISIQDASSNLIQDNVISANGSAGVAISGEAGSANQLYNNRIGTDIAGTGALGNGLGGVIINGAFDTVIGDSEVGGNIIAFNGIEALADGVTVLSGSRNSIRANSIFSNNGLGINLGTDSVTPNDPDDIDFGPNNLQNFPVITSVNSSGGSTTITGTLDSTPGTYAIDFFSNSACDPSGHGEGQNYIGSTTITISGGGGPLAATAPLTVGFSATFPVTLSGTQVVTATATNGSGSTSEFSACATVIAPITCQITCPPRRSAIISGAACAASVTYPPPTTTSPSCGQVTCSPPSGSSFPVGLTVVTCSIPDGPQCSFTVSVVDFIAPTITCPQNIGVRPAAGQTSAAAEFSLPTAVDNCQETTVVCQPPSGTVFPLGSTTVTCSAVDLSNNTATCSFTVTVDSQPPVITCPANVVVNAAASQCLVAVSYPPPTSSDDQGGPVVTCVPPSGASFAAGVTTVTCTSRDRAGNTSTCAFTVTVNAQQQLSVTLENGSQLEFGTPDVPRKQKDDPPDDCDCDRVVQITNNGCRDVTLTLSAIMRMGADVTSGRITDTDDSDIFSVRRIPPPATPPIGDGVPFNIGQSITIRPGQREVFLVIFNPFIPSFANRTNNLPASAVLPDVVLSKLVFTQNGGNPVVVNLVGEVEDDVQLINPNNTRKKKRVQFEKSGDEFVITFGVYDPDLNSTRARFEFLDANGQLVGQAFEVDLTGPLGSSQVVEGQSVTIVQRFAGARSNSRIVSVRVTVIDPGASDTVTGQLGQSAATASIQTAQAAERVVVLLPVKVMGAPIR